MNYATVDGPSNENSCRKLLDILECDNCAFRSFCQLSSLKKSLVALQYFTSKIKFRVIYEIAAERMACLD